MLSKAGIGDGLVMLTERQLADRWNCSVKVLQARRLTGDGCPFRKLLKGMVRYHIDDVRAYEAAAIRNSTSSSAPG